VQNSIHDLIIPKTVRYLMQCLRLRPEIGRPDTFDIGEYILATKFCHSKVSKPNDLALVIDDNQSSADVIYSQFFWHVICVQRDRVWLHRKYGLYFSHRKDPFSFHKLAEGERFTVPIFLFHGFDHSVGGRIQ